MESLEDRTRRLLGEEIEAELGRNGSLLPPWKRHPELDRYASGWRSGYGEWYLMAWWQWAEDKTHDQLLSYFREHLPIPVEWIDWVALQLFADDDFDDPQIPIGKLQSLGLADLGAWKSWWATFNAAG